MKSKAVQRFNPQTLNPTPTEGALMKAAEEINSTLRSRAHLLSVIDALTLDKMTTDTKMAYVLGLLSLGFTRSRALARLRVGSSAFNTWARQEDNEIRLEECEARGELVLEESLLLAAESDAKFAALLLNSKDARREKRESLKRDERKRVEDFFMEGLKDRGLVKEAKIIKEGDELD